jgi:LAO/AO transport system kinase
VRGISRREQFSASRYVEGILGGDRSILAKAITLIESSHPGDCELAAEILEDCVKRAGHSIVVGVSGVPGAGKSSLIEVLGKQIITTYREKVAVLAIDPSSRVSGGSILGDKTRMPFLASSEMAFIRPSPSRGRLGGVAEHTRDSIALCEAAGYRNVFVETVGVGQSESAVRDMADFFLLVALAGAGDELQGIKRGVMEMADTVAVNKADGDNVRQAEKARAEAERALHFLSASASGWTPRAIACSARTGVGVREIWALILEHHKVISQCGYVDQLRREQNLRWLHENVERGLMQMFVSNPMVEQRMTELEMEVGAGQITPTAAARRLLSLFKSDRLSCGCEQKPLS